MSHLTSVKQKIHECVAEYIRRFRDIRNRCYSLIISDRDLADLAFMKSGGVFVAKIIDINRQQQHKHLYLHRPNNLISNQEHKQDD